MERESFTYNKLSHKKLFSYETNITFKNIISYIF